MGNKKQATAHKKGNKPNKAESNKKARMQSVIDLDSISAPSFPFTYNGEEHELVEPGIETYLRIQELQEEQLTRQIEDAKEPEEGAAPRLDGLKKFKQMREMKAKALSLCCETLDESDFIKMKESQLNFLNKQLGVILMNAYMAVVTEPSGGGSNSPLT